MKIFVDCLIQKNSNDPMKIKLPPSPLQYQIAHIENHLSTLCTIHYRSSSFLHAVGYTTRL